MRAVACTGRLIPSARGQTAMNRLSLRLRGSLVRRRVVLQIGGISLLGLSLPRLLEVAAEASGQRGSAEMRATADGCLLVFLNGGPSHLDMWDMKPGAPSGIRGEFRPIASRLPTVSVCEHLPRFAQWIHHGTLIRSAHHQV